MSVALITGTGRGIGCSFAKLLLNKKWIVYGFSRTNKIQHPNFYFNNINLEDVSSLTDVSFPKLKNNTKVLLVNNAAKIGSITSLEKKISNEIISEYNLNIISPTIICKEFLYKYKANPKTILNISSGAAKNSISGWSTYCSSKAALDMLTNVISSEKHVNLKVFSIYPGIVNTSMQNQIRNAKESDFPLIKKFIDYHTNNILESPEKIAEKLYYIVENKSSFTKNSLSLRDVNIC